MTTRIVIRNGGLIIHPDDDFKEDLRLYLTRMHEMSTVKAPKRDGCITIYVSEKKLKQKWYLAADDLSVVRVHQSYLEEIKQLYHFRDIEYIDERVDGGGYVTDIPLKESTKPKEDQKPWVEFLTDQANGVHKTLPASMGGGKTITAILVANKLKRRVMAVIPPYLSSNWRKAITQFSELEEEEFIYVSGAKELIKLQNQLINGLFNYKFVLFSINTIQGYLSTYKYNKIYPLTPDVFFDLCNFGLKVVDEAHTFMHFHLTLDLYTNIPNYLKLTGTIDKEDPFLIEMEGRIFPLKSRCPVPEPSNHVTLKAYNYNFVDEPPVSSGPMGYSQVIYESNLQRYPSQLAAIYTNMAKILYTDYILRRDDSKGKQRALVWFGKKELADDFLIFLKTNSAVKEHFAKFDLGRFKAGDEDDVFMGLDIIISTTRKSGTGVDIPDLINIVQFINVSSKGENKQNLGRLRNIEGTDTIFSYLYCNQIRKHVEYSKKRFEELDKLVKVKHNINLQLRIPTPNYSDNIMAAQLDKERREARRLARIKDKKRISRAAKKKAERNYFR